MTLESVVAGYKKLNLPHLNSYYAHVPHIVVKVMDRINQLKEQGKYKTSELLDSFMNCYKNGNDWSPVEEENLSKIKQSVNQRKDNISEIDDPRYLSQLMLDFFQSLSQPAIPGTFRREWQHVLGDNDLILKFVRSELPEMEKIKETVYHTLEFIAMSMNQLIGKNPDAQRLSVLRLTLLRISLSLTQTDKPRFFHSRHILPHAEYLEYANVDPITKLLYAWTTEYSPKAKDVYLGLHSPMPNLHKKIMDIHGSSTLTNPDKFNSRRLSSSFIKIQKDHLKSSEKGPERPTITEEDDPSLSVISDQNSDDFPEEIKVFLPIFRDMPYEEQNSIIKELYNIMQKPTAK